MGFFDEEVKDSFDEMFDMNGDGYLDPSERLWQMSFLDDDENSDRYDNFYDEDE